MQSSASPDPVSPVERELDRFLGLLKLGREEVSERSSCRLLAPRACSLDLIECALSGASSAEVCGRRHRRRRAVEES